MSENPEKSPSQSKGINNEENPAPITSRQINNIIEFQGPSTSNNNYSFKTEIRINIMGEPRISQRSVDSDDSSFILSLFEDKINKDPIEPDESYVTLDTCLKEKTTNTLLEPVVLFSRNDRTQRTILSQSEAPPPYESHPPPAYHISGQEMDSVFYHSCESLEIPFGEIKTRHTFVQKAFFMAAQQVQALFALQ
ncbi:unnamed protein product [Ceutorhynchus assimilis]|uniref:Uncharacterized protein n=1 Tax=Ceutorhynchus assimilis TaxID=467358 RepID=A0A9N9MYU1_9CUCU|nr:unnamed protein product [Ceutorhynchus assimilis]